MKKRLTFPQNLGKKIIINEGFLCRYKKGYADTCKINHLANDLLVQNLEERAMFIAKQANNSAKLMGRKTILATDIPFSPNLNNKYTTVGYWKNPKLKKLTRLAIDDNMIISTDYLTKLNNILEQQARSVVKISKEITSIAKKKTINDMAISYGIQYSHILDT